MIDVERIRELAKKSEQQPKCESCGSVAPVLLKSPSGRDFCKSCVEKMTVPTNREATREELIVRQNALAHADAMFGKLTGGKPSLTLEEDLADYFEFAERCEQWILRSVKR